MAKSSYRGYIDRIAPGTFAEGQPVSATQAFLLRNNMLHLLDQMCQHRINWVCGTDPAGFGGHGCFAALNLVLLDGTVALYEQDFPHVWLNPGHPGNLDILIRSSISDTGGSEEMSVRVRVVPAYYDIGNMTGPSLVDETHSVTTTTGSWEDQFFFDPDDDNTMNILRSASIREFEVIEDGDWHYPELSMLKLQVELTYVDGATPIYALLTGVTVREFA